MTVRANHTCPEVIMIFFFFFKLCLNIPAYVIHKILQPVRIISPIPDGLNKVLDVLKKVLDGLGKVWDGLGTARDFCPHFLKSDVPYFKRFGILGEK